MEKNVILEGLNAEEIWSKLYNKELNCKKNILEYIDITRILKKEKADIYQIEATYNLIYNSIDKIADKVKPNTIMYLQNQLKNQLGKYVSIKEPKIEDNFIKFFKEAYPANERRKDFTWVLMDINSITEEQIWNTLIYINRECLKDNLRLDSEEKQDIIKMIKKLIEKNNIKYINQIKSLEKLNNILGIRVVNKKE